MKSQILNPKIYCLHYNECKSSKCTSRKLNRLNLLTIIKKIDSPLYKAIILNPFSQKILSIDDREKLLKHGLIVIDCSWKNILKLKDLISKNSRKLPSLIAANPVNFGKWEKLSSAEAIAAALYITKFEDYAKLILSKFSWGKEFFKINYKKK